jgi:cytochrome c-type biogenesis protein CcmH
MLLWFVFAVLTAAVLAFVLAPLVRARPGEADAGTAGTGSIAVYRDQLDEIAAEQTRGLLGAAEADAARLEISRRILAADTPVREPATSLPRALLESRHATLALAAAIAVPLLTAGLYALYGAPQVLSGETEAAREASRIAGLVAQVEERLRNAPDDGKGWEVIAPVYLRLGRFAEAADAYGKALRLQGDSPALLAGLAESSMLAAGGVVTTEARAAYEKLHNLDPRRVEPRFWLAMAKEQSGDLPAALADYKALLASAPADAPYRQPLEMRVREVSSQIAARDAGLPAGPSAADVAAASKLDPAQRAQMITQMVEGLAERLKENGNDLAGWLRLVRAYSVLDRKDDARAALAEARRNFTADANALAELSKLASSLGLGS